MTKIEMNRRLATMTPKAIEEIRDMVRLGYGAHGIKREHTATIKQINAVFALATGNF